MTIFSWLSLWPFAPLRPHSGIDAAPCLRALRPAGLAAGLVLATLPALAATRPDRFPDRHLTTAHRVSHGRMLVQTPSAADGAQSPRAKSRSAGKSGPKNGSRAKSAPKNATGSAHPAPRTRRHKLRLQDEADNDPLVLHRAHARRGRLQRSNVTRQAIATHKEPPGDRLAPARSSGEEVAGKKALTSADFLKAAGAAMPDSTPNVDPPTEAATGERGQSHPDDDERLPMRRPTQVVDEVSAAPAPITPSGTPTLPEKLHAAAVRAEAAVKVDATSAKSALSDHRSARTSVMPEDHAGRAAVVQQAMTPLVLPTLYTRRGKLIVPPPMKGSWDILVHQNTMADSEGLDRIRDDDDLDRMRALHLLVPLQRSVGLAINEELPENRRYARPWTARFAADTARAFYSRFHQPLRLNSAVRTVEYQLRLQRVNGNAAAVDGDGASPHLTGQAVDFGKRGMSIAQIAWMRAYLAPLMQAGKLDVEEEFQQACFHVSVYRSYAPLVKTGPRPAPKTEVAQLRAEPPVVKTRVAEDLGDSPR